MSTQVRICQYVVAHGRADVGALVVHLAPLERRSISMAVKALVRAKHLIYTGYAPASAGASAWSRVYRITPTGRRLAQGATAALIATHRIRERDTDLPPAETPSEGFGHGIGRRVWVFDTSHLDLEGEPS